MATLRTLMPSGRYNDDTVREATPGRIVRLRHRWLGLGRLLRLVWTRVAHAADRLVDADDRNLLGQIAIWSLFLLWGLFVFGYGIGLAFRGFHLGSGG